MTIEKMVSNFVYAQAREMWKDDKTPPMFLVSYNAEQELITLTCTHNNSSYSALINVFTDVEKTMEELYNQTM